MQILMALLNTHPMALERLFGQEILDTGAFCQEMASSAEAGGLFLTPEGKVGGEGAPIDAGTLQDLLLEAAEALEQERDCMDALFERRGPGAGEAGRWLQEYADRIEVGYLEGF